MAKITDLQELLKHELKDLYSAETQLLDALPKMAEKANNPDLKKAFNDHLKVTGEHQKRLDTIQAFFNIEKATETKGFFANLFKSKEGEEHCKAMEGLIKEADSLMSEDMSPEVMDAALIAAAQKVEHYEISSYGTARAYATQLGFKKVVDLLSATLAEEYFADDSLTSLAVGKVNVDAEDADTQTPVAGKKPVGKLPTKTSQKKETAVATSQKVPVAKTAAKTAAKKISDAKPADMPVKKTLVKKVAKSAPPKKAAKKSTKKTA